MRFQYLLFIFLISSGKVLGQGIVVTELPKEQLILPECSSLSKKTRLKPGVKCRTSLGIVFIRQKSGWLDSGRGGVVWYDKVYNGVQQEFSKSVCRRRKQKLPSLEDYKIAKKHGFEEVLSKMGFFFYWTSTNIEAQGTAYGYASSSRDFATLPADWGNYKDRYYIVARCISSNRPRQ